MPLFPSRRAGDLRARDVLLARARTASGPTRSRSTTRRRCRPTGEVVIPPKRATNAVALGHAALSDDDRFVAIFNWTTGTSLSIVDVEQRTLRRRDHHAGLQPRLCRRPAPLLLPVRRRLGVHRHARRRRSRGEPRRAASRSSIRKADPVTEKAVRYGNQWLFVSFDGQGAIRSTCPARELTLRRRRGRCSATPIASSRGASAGCSTSRCISARGRLYIAHAPRRPRYAQGLRAKRCGSTTSPPRGGSRASSW